MNKLIYMYIFNQRHIFWSFNYYLIYYVCYLNFFSNIILTARANSSIARVQKCAIRTIFLCISIPRPTFIHIHVIFSLLNFIIFRKFRTYHSWIYICICIHFSFTYYIILCIILLLLLFFLIFTLIWIGWFIFIIIYEACVGIITPV